jgi:hypothetical protein
MFYNFSTLPQQLQEYQQELKKHLGMLQNIIFSL